MDSLANAELCKYCSKPGTICVGSDNDSRLFNNMKNQLMPTPNDTKPEFIGDIPPFCPPCKELATRLERKQKELEEIKSEIEKKIFVGVLLDPTLPINSQLQLSAEQTGLAEFRSHCFNSYRKKLQIENQQRLAESSNPDGGGASAATFANLQESDTENLETGSERETEMIRGSSTNNGNSAAVGIKNAYKNMEEHITIRHDKDFNELLNQSGERLTPLKCPYKRLDECPLLFADPESRDQHVLVHQTYANYGELLAKKSFEENPAQVLDKHSIQKNSGDKRKANELEGLGISTNKIRKPIMNLFDIPPYM